MSSTTKTFEHNGTDGAASSSLSSVSTSRIAEIKHECAALITSGASAPEALKEPYIKLIQEFLELGGNKSDMIVLIAESMFGLLVPNGLNDRSQQGPHEHDPIAGGIRIDFDYLEGFMYDCFRSVGVPEKESRVSAHVLIEADKRGIDSHGIGRLKPIYFDRIKKGILNAYAPISVIKETDTTAFLDGNMGLGLYIGPHCMDMAIQKAKKHGIGFIVVKNSTHYGIAGYYATMATSQNCIGWTGTNARPSIAPTFGVEPCLGTNPLCFGVPTDEEFPFVIDCATSINQRGKIEKYARLGQQTPRGMVIDTNGEERTDTNQILLEMVKGTCALTPMGGAGDHLGGYKGYGWATLVELLSTAFQSGPFVPDTCGVDRLTGKPAPMPLGHYFLAINVEALVDIDVFKRNSGNLLRKLRSTEKDPRGPGKIWTAGEPEHENRVERTASGGVVVPPVLLQDMKDLRDYLPDVKQKYAKFSFE